MLSSFFGPFHPTPPAYTPRILPSQLKPLFPVETLRFLVYPYIPFDIPGIEQYPDSDPVWFSCLEPHYLLVCPLIFDLLEQEDKHSHAIVLTLVEEHDRLISYRMNFGDYPAKLKREEAAVMAQMLERWTSVYALHEMRKAFLDHHWNLEQQQQQYLVEKGAPTSFCYCLVSNQLCAIAQPLLLQVWSTTTRDFSALSDYPHLASHIHDYPHLASHIHVLARPPLSLVAAVIAPLQSLREVKIDAGAGAWLSELAHLQNLESLVLPPTSLPDISSLVFFDLDALTLRNVRPHFDGFRLPGSSFPALQALYTNSYYVDKQSSELRPIEPTNLRPGQLDSYQLPSYLFNGSSLSLHGHTTPLLLTVDIEGTSTLSHPAFDEYVNGDFRSILDLVERSKTFKSLSLPNTVSQTRLSSPSSGSLRDDLMQVCVERPIDIIWRHHSKESDDDIAVSKDFWEYAKELKRKQQLEVEGA